MLIRFPVFWSIVLLIVMTMIAVQVYGRPGRAVNFTNTTNVLVDDNSDDDDDDEDGDDISNACFKLAGCNEFSIKTS